MADLDWDSILEDSVEDIISNNVSEVVVSHKLHKTEEEIAQFTIDETLSDIDRALYLLSNGTTLQQKQSVLENLKGLFIDHSSESRTKVLPQLILMAQNESLDFQINLSTALMKLLCIDDEVNYKMADSIVVTTNTTTTTINNNRRNNNTTTTTATTTFDSFLSQKNIQSILALCKCFLYKEIGVWDDLFLKVVQRCPVDIVQDEILPGTNVSGGLQHPSSYRIFCCRILGNISSVLPQKLVEDEIIPKVSVLCQDTDFEVRAEMSENLNLVSRGVSLTKFKSDVLPEYIELLQDERDIVRDTAICSILSLVPDILDLDTIVNVVIPNYKRATEQVCRILFNTAKHFGTFILYTKDHLNSYDLKYFINVYHEMADSDLENVREMTAYNLPCIVSLLGKAGFTSYKLNQILEILSHDQLVDVRVRLAAGFHEIAKVLGNESYSQLKRIFTVLLLDPEVAVAQKIIKDMSGIMASFVTDESSRKLDQMTEMLFMILKRERELSNDPTYTWRNHLQFIDAFRYFPEYFEPDQIHDHCLCHFFKLLNDDLMIPIQASILKSMCLYLRKFKRVDQREHVLRYLKDFKHATGYQRRQQFLDIAMYILDYFSKNYFKSVFFHDCLDLARDKTVNIRLKFISMAGLIYDTLVLPADITLLSKFRSVLNELEKDSSTEISARSIVLNNKIYSASSGKQHLFHWDTETINAKWDEDKRREEEERAMLMDWEIVGGSRSQLKTNSNEIVNKSDEKLPHSNGPSQRAKQAGNSNSLSRSLTVPTRQPGSPKVKEKPGANSSNSSGKDSLTNSSTTIPRRKTSSNSSRLAPSSSSSKIDTIRKDTSSNTSNPAKKASASSSTHSLGSGNIYSKTTTTLKKGAASTTTKATDIAKKAMKSSGSDSDLLAHKSGTTIRSTTTSFKPRVSPLSKQSK